MAGRDPVRCDRAQPGRDARSGKKMPQTRPCPRECQSEHEHGNDPERDDRRRVGSPDKQLIWGESLPPRADMLPPFFRST